jgi:hypothetical protein
MKRINFSIIFCLIVIISNAQSWNSANGISDKTVRIIISYNADILLAGVDNEGIYISNDNGENWNQFALNGESIYSLIKVDSNIIAGTYGNGLFISTLADTQWINISINDLVINKLSINNDTLFACTYGLSGPGAIYFSTDTAGTWTQFATTPPYAYLDIDFNSQGRVFVATPFGAYYSDNQSTWIKTTGFGSTVRTVNYIGNDSLIYGDDLGIFLSTDNGVSGQELAGISAGIVYYLNDTFYVATPGSGLYYTNEIGSTWLSLNLNEYGLTLLKSNGKLLAGTPEGIFYLTESAAQVYNNTNYPDINVFPNPVRDILYIENQENSNCNIKIFSTIGDIVLESLNNKKVNMSALTSGIYFYKVTINENIYTGKIIKE